MTLNVWTGFVFATAEICVVVASACGGAKHSPSTHYRHSNFPMRIIAADKNEHEKEKRIVSFAPSGSAALESESAANFWLYVHRAVRCLAASPRTHTFTLAKQQKKMYYFQSVSRTTEWNVRRVCVSGGGRLLCVRAHYFYFYSYSFHFCSPRERHRAHHTTLYSTFRVFSLFPSLLLLLGMVYAPLYFIHS